VIGESEGRVGQEMLGKRELGGTDDELGILQLRIALPAFG
jgi:hypothetical protein